MAGVLLDYNLFASHYQPQEGSSTDNANAYGTAGANFGVHGGYVAIISTIKRMPREGQPITAASHASICSVLCRRLARN